MLFECIHEQKSKIGIHGGGGGDKGADFLWTLGLTTVEVDCSIKFAAIAEREVS
jgi:hypothetical protein